MFRPSRDPVGTRFFALKSLLLVLGTSVGLVGMVQERTWLVWIGLGILLVAVALRLVAGRKDQSD